MSFFSCAGAPSYIFPPSLSPTLVLYQLVPLHRPLCMSIFISVYIPKSTVFFDVFLIIPFSNRVVQRTLLKIKWWNQILSNKQNQTNTWWQSVGLLFRTQIGLPLLTIDFLLVRSPKSALQRWRLGWSDKLTGFFRDEGLFVLVFLLAKLRFICIQSISKRIV